MTEAVLLMPANEPARLRAVRDLEILDTPPEPIYDDVVKLAAAICRAPIAVMNFVDADRQWGKALVGVESSEAPREASFCARTIVHADGVLVVPDTLDDPAWAHSPMVVGEGGLRFYAGTAIVDDGGYAVGSVCVADRRPRQLDEAAVEALRILARQAAAHLALRRRNAELQRMAVTDALTGLPNRTLLFDRHAQAMRRRTRTGAAVAVMFCDADGFKAINDGLGHDVGDAVLRAVAERLSSAARAGDTVARLAGDEFVVVCPDLPDDVVVPDIGRRLVAAVERPLPVPGGGELMPRLSIGIALVRDGDDVAGVLRRADEAMYDAKREAALARV